MSFATVVCAFIGTLVVNAIAFLIFSLDKRRRIQKLTIDAQHLQLAEVQAQLDRYSQIVDAESFSTKLIAEAESRAKATNKQVVELKEQVTAFEGRRNRIQVEVSGLEETLAKKHVELGLLNKESDIQSFGVYPATFLYDDSDEYKHALTDCKDEQKEMIQCEEACYCKTTWTVSDSEAKGRTMTKRNIKLMLRAINGECNAIITKASHQNYESSIERIKTSFRVIEKLGATMEFFFASRYLELKLLELQLNYERVLKKEEERQQARDIREAMREEEKAVNEIKKALKDAEDDESAKTKALELARAEVAELHGKQNDRLERLIEKLERELQGAIDRKAKAIARAQLTKSGHVYILSNIGTMGEGIFKIGLTRRLEPMERVRELGSASVPFPFDVHAMIYSEDAPSLEKALHNHLDNRRVNLVNLRREYFRVSIGEIREAVQSFHGDVTFKIVPDADQFRASEATRNSDFDKSCVPPLAQPLIEYSDGYERTSEDYQQAVDVEDSVYTERARDQHQYAE